MYWALDIVHDQGDHRKWFDWEKWVNIFFVSKMMIHSYPCHLGDSAYKWRRHRADWYKHSGEFSLHFYMNCSKIPSIIFNSNPKQEIIRHPDYKASTRQNDIALFRLAETVECTNIIRPACLRIDLADVLPNVGLVVTGWGSFTTSLNADESESDLS